MAGHSKFKNIMYRKGAQDKKRSALFSRLAREITVAARSGLPDASANARLRAAIAAAKGQSMPKDNIQRAIDRAAGNEGDNYEEIRYEGYGPDGVSLIVDVLTDNRNRSATNIRTAFSKNGGNLGTTGSVSHGFERMGQIIYPAAVGDADAMFEAALEAGASDVESNEDEHELWTDSTTLHTVAAELEEKFGEAQNVRLAWRATIKSEVSDEKTARSLFKLIDTLDDDDDVQNVWGNYDIADEIMDKIE